MLIRLLRYKESLQETDAKSLYDAELARSDGSPDLELSVYAADARLLMELTLEHFADAGNDPPRHATAVDVSPVRGSAVAEPTSGRFSLSSTSHCILKFEDKLDQLDFAKLLVDLLASDSPPAWTHPKHELRAWLKQRIDSHDLEWNTFMATANDAWRKFPKRSNP